MKSKKWWLQLKKEYSFVGLIWTWKLLSQDVFPKIYCTFTFLFFLLPFHPTFVCGGLLVLFWRFLCRTLQTGFFSFNASSIAAHLCIVLMRFLVPVPSLVALMMFFARLSVWFCMADIFAWRRRVRGARLWLQALVLICVIASLWWGAVLFLPRRRWWVVCVIPLFLFLFHVAGLFLRWGFPCVTIASTPWLLTPGVRVRPRWFSDMTVGGSVSQQYRVRIKDQHFSKWNR